MGSSNSELANSGPQIRPFSVTDFAGGITDNIIPGKPNQYEKADNFIIDDNGKLIVRPGSQIYDSTYYQVPGGADRIGRYFDHDEVLFIQSKRDIHWIDGGWQTFAGPVDSNEAIGVCAETNFVSSAFWNKHTLLTCDSFSSPMKFYKDSGGTYRIRNAGLPSPTLMNCIELANDIRTVYTAHIADVADHTAGADATNTITAPLCYDFETLLTLVAELQTDFTAHEGDSELGAAWLYHAAQETGDHSLANETVAPTTLAEVVILLTEFKTQYNAHDADATTHGVGGAHQVTKTPNYTATPSAGTGNAYIYRLVASFEYTVGDKTFIDYGPIKEVTCADSGPAQTNNVTIAGIPIISNQATENWDTATIKWNVYRTEASGTVFYYVGAVTNGTASYTDSSADATINLAALLYTEGGVLDNDLPPKSKIVVVANNCAWYMHLKIGNDVFSNQIRQSVQNDIDSVPGSFNTDVEGEIVGGAAAGKYPIVFCNNGRIYRLEGIVDELGRGGTEVREITRVVKCVSANSIVQSRHGIYFAAQDGFYHTDGFRVTKISDEFNATYASMIAAHTNLKTIYGAYDGDKDKVFWACQRTSTNSDNDAWFTFDCRQGPTKRSGAFTSASNGAYFYPTALIYFDGNLLRGDTRGYSFKHDVSFRTDPKVDTAVVPSLWEEFTITYDYKSTANPFGTTALQKWVPQFSIEAEDVTNLSIEVKSYNDNSIISKSLREIRYDGILVWGDSSLEWGDADLVWNQSGFIKGRRRFPAGTLRCWYKTIEITNAYTTIDNSDTLGLATVDTALKTVTIDSATKIWPSTMVDYYISFVGDSYVQQFFISVRTSDTVLTILDPTNDLVAGSQKWLIKGYRKGQVVNIISYSMGYGYMTSTDGLYGGDPKANA